MQLRNQEITNFTDSHESQAFWLQSTNDFRLQPGVRVYIQSFRGLPVRLRTQDAWNEHEQAFPQAFQDAMDEVLDQTDADATGNCWFFYGERHGPLEEVAQVVIQEIVSFIDEEELDRWKQNALQTSQHKPHVCSIALVQNYLRNNRGWNQPTQPTTSFFPTQNDPNGYNTLAMIRAMNHPNRHLRQTAVQFFATWCEDRRDHYQPKN